MCPSYRATGDEQHLTRGRANSLRLAISGQLGKDAFLSPEMKRTMDLCVSCKACRRECPDRRRHGQDEDRVPAPLPCPPRAAPARAPGGRDAALRRDRRGAEPPAQPAQPLRHPGEVRRGSPRLLGAALAAGLAAALARSRRAGAPQDVVDDVRDIVLFGDTFNRAFERENLEAAERVLTAAGYRLHRVLAHKGRRPSAAAARGWPPARPTGRGKRRAGRSTRSCPSCAPVRAWSGWSPPASSPSATSSVAPAGGRGEDVAERSLLFEELLAADLAAGRIPCRSGSRGAASRICTAIATRRVSA